MSVYVKISECCAGAVCVQLKGINKKQWPFYK